MLLNWRRYLARASTYAERPDLAARTGEVEDTLAPFMGYGEVALRHWAKLRPELPELQLILYDDEYDRVMGHARTLPARGVDGLPGGIDDVVESGSAPARARSPTCSRRWSPSSTADTTVRVSPGC